MAFKQERERKRSLQPRQRRAYGVDRLASFLQLLIYEMSDHLGICVRDKASAGQLKLLTQLPVILDNAVVNDRNTIDRVWMRVVFVRAAVSRPAGVTDAYEAAERIAGKFALEVLEFADGAPKCKKAPFKCRDTG
jgi:hypothetical protein